MVRFFFFKPKTAYGLRISDWSSDVCSSDLLRVVRRPLEQRCDTVLGLEHLVIIIVGKLAEEAMAEMLIRRFLDDLLVNDQRVSRHDQRLQVAKLARSEERSVGKECVSKCRSRWSPGHEHKQIYMNKR